MFYVNIIIPIQKDRTRPLTCAHAACVHTKLQVTEHQYHSMQPPPLNCRGRVHLVCISV